MSMPGLTAESSLPSEKFPSIHRAVLRDFDNRSRIVPARSWIGEAICGAAYRTCLDGMPEACGVYVSLCTMGGPFE